MQIEKIEKKSGGRIQLFLQIFTGRTHQIRVYLSNHGLSIIGDYLYGKESEEAMQLTAYQLEFEDLGGENRFFAVLSYFAINDSYFLLVGGVIEKGFCDSSGIEDGECTKKIR